MHSHCCCFKNGELLCAASSMAGIHLFPLSQQSQKFFVSYLSSHFDWAGSVPPPLVPVLQRLSAPASLPPVNH